MPKMPQHYAMPLTGSLPGGSCCHHPSIPQVMDDARLRTVQNSTQQQAMMLTMVPAQPMLKGQGRRSMALRT